MDRNFWVTFSAGLPQILSLVVLFVLAVATLRRREKIKWAYSFLLVLFSIAIWDIADILELFSTNLEMYHVVIKIAYLGIATLPIFWFLFIINYTGKESWITPGKVILSVIIPVLTLIFTFTDESFHLMRTVLSYDASGQFSIVKIQYGPWFWVHSANSYLLLLLSVILLIHSALTTSGLFVGQKIFLISASVLPWISNILYLTRITNSDYTTTAFTLLSLALAVSVFRYQLLNLVPIAREIVFENMTDSVIVLNRENRVIDLNPAAIPDSKIGTKGFLGSRFEEIFPDFARLLEKSLANEELKEEIGIPFESPIKYFTVQINTLKGKKGANLGKIIVIRNSSEQKFARLALQDMNEELETRVEQRTAELVKELEIRKQVESALRKSEERYSLAILGANDGIWDWDLKSGQIFFSPRWKSMLGYGEDELESSIDSWFNKVHPDDIDLLRIEISRHLNNTSAYFQFTHRLFHKDGNLLWVLCRGLAKRSEDGIAYRMSGSLTDITQQKLYEEQILHDAFHDNLTNLPNRTFFLERVSHSIQRAKRSKKEQFAVIFLDLDRFKNINDSLGHVFGDKLLKTCADRLLRCVRSIDTVARLGGDEFVVLIDSITGIQEAQVVTDRINKSLSETIFLDKHEISITSSIGIVLFSDQYENAEEILRDADIAMYKAKRNSISHYAVFNLEMRDMAFARLELETELRHALEFSEFEMFYQPIIRVEDNHLVSFEALIRWKHPTRGYVLPSEFIPLAEETGLIIPIGQWVISEASQQISEWKKIIPFNRHISVNINLSARQFADSRLYENIQKNLKQFKIEGNNLVLEITESSIIEDRESAIKTLKKLKTLGVQVQIDDFGTGYSSLSYLHTLPVDALKIDRSFVNQIDAEDNLAGVEIIQTIISLGRELGKKVIAEGVETQNELEKLTEMGCGYIQGYLISKPMDKTMAKNFLLNEITR